MASASLESMKLVPGKLRTLDQGNLRLALEVVAKGLAGKASSEERHAALRAQLPPEVQVIFDRAHAYMRTVTNGQEKVFSRFLLLREGGVERALLAFGPYDVFLLAKWKEGEAPVIGDLPTHK